MLKKILFSLIFILFIVNIYYFYIISKNSDNIWKTQTNLIFVYPDLPINFAWEEMPNDEKDYFIKENFDKEFLKISYNLYQFFLYVKRMPIYMDTIDEEIKKGWIPYDFRYLPIVESALKQDAISSAKAVWIWQFMPETAKEYWLIVNQEIDERYNFEKSTKSAVKYIKKINKSLNNWTLTAASYNVWPTSLKKSLKEQNVKSYYDLYLNEETSKYVFKILAVKYIIIQYEKNKVYIDKIMWWTYKKPKTKLIKVEKIDDLKEWCKLNNYNYLDIKNLNMWILKNKVPKWNWEIKVFDK